MTRLTWGDPGSQVIEAGVSRGVLYPEMNGGVAWDGLIGVNSQPKGGTKTAKYQDGVKVHTKTSPQEFSATIQAYTYPDDFAMNIGEVELDEGLYASEQDPRPFGLSYQTKIGNTLGRNSDFKIHLVYNALATISNANYQTLSELPSPITFSWDVTTTPVVVPGIRPASHFIVDSRKTGPLALQGLLDILHGTDSSYPRIPSPQELVSHFVDWHVLYPSSSTFPSDTTFPGGP